MGNDKQPIHPISNRTKHRYMEFQLNQKLA